jgi:hypothetical protein
VLYGLGQQSKMYTIDETGGGATVLGGVFTTPLSGTNFDMDFDPAGFTEVRITTDTDQNLLWTGGSSVTAQSPIAWATGDPSFGGDPNAVGIAYTNNYPNASSTQLFAYDYITDKLATLPNPSNGKMTSVGPSGVTAQGTIDGLDTAPDGTTFALLSTSPGPTTKLFTVAADGHVNSLGTVGNGSNTAIDIATDSVTNVFHFEASSYNVSESARTVDVTITRSQTLGLAQVHYASADGSAKAGDDYSQAADDITFDGGVASKTVKLKLKSDAIDEGTETFNVTLSSPAGGHASITSPSSAIVQIEDDDTGPPPSIKVTALRTPNDLVTFDSAAPESVSASLPITGLPGGETLTAIDRRPATGQLYALSTQSRLYTIDEVTGAATQVGSGPFSPALGPAGASGYGFDFDPVTDQIRVVAADAQNLRLNPTDGTAVADTKLAYVPGDPGHFVPVLGALAYSNNVPGAASSSLYGYDFSRDTIVRVGAPGDSASANGGAVTTIGPTGVLAGNAFTGLDIAPDGTAWAMLADTTPIRLEIVDLATGLVSYTGKVGNGAPGYEDIALPPVTNVIGLSGDSFSAAEGAGFVPVTLTRSQSLGSATVDYAMTDGSAGATDYTASSGSATFAAGEASTVVQVPLVNDRVVEGTETLTFTVSNPRGGVASLGATPSATVTITDDDTVVVEPKPKPRVSTCHKAKQDIVKKKAALVCVKSDVAGRATLTGKLVIRGVRKSVALKKAAGTVRAGKRRTFKLKLSRKALASVRKHRKFTAKVTIRVRSAAGMETKVGRTIKAKSKRR